MIRLATASVVVVLWAACAVPTAAAGSLSPSGEPRAVLGRVLPGEFERQDAVLVSWDSNDEIMQRAVARIISAAWRRVNFLVLVSSPESQMAAMAALRQAGIPRSAVRYIMVPFDSVWTRDYGPATVVSFDGTSELIDAEYGHGDRGGDDGIPAAVAPLLGLAARRAPLSIDGGNLLSNGEGLLLTSYALVEHNSDKSYTAGHVEHVLRAYYGAQQVVFLEQLAGEPTGHVDMFAAFVGADTVVVGEYAPAVDPVNAQILDRNAELLQQVRTPRGPLNVVRIPMPPRRPDVWPSYTNVLFANGSLIVPTYPGLDPSGEAVALAMYRQLLPGWTVVGINCSELIEWGGAIHCVTRNLTRLPPQTHDQLTETERGRHWEFLPPRLPRRTAPRPIVPAHDDPPGLDDSDGWRPAEPENPIDFDGGWSDAGAMSGEPAGAGRARNLAAGGAFPASGSGFQAPVRRVRPMFARDVP